MTQQPFLREGAGLVFQATPPETPGLLRPQENGPWLSRAAEMAAIFMVGDGLIGLLQPRRHVDLWKDDALGTEKLVAPFVDRPGRRRLYAVVQITGSRPGGASEAMKAAGWALLALALAGCGSAPDAAGDQIANGKRVFQRCTACHTIGQYATDTDGPNLYGLMGAPIGERRTRFSYTAGLKALGGNWDKERMDRWLANPRGMVPGTTMAFAGLADPKDRADVIAYLATQGP